MIEMNVYLANYLKDMKTEIIATIYYLTEG